MSTESASAHTGKSVRQTSIVTMAIVKNTKKMLTYQVSGTSGYERINFACTSSSSVCTRLIPLYILREWYRAV